MHDINNPPEHILPSKIDKLRPLYAVIPAAVFRRPLFAPSECKITLNAFAMVIETPIFNHDEAAAAPFFTAGDEADAPFVVDPAAALFECASGFVILMYIPSNVFPGGGGSRGQKVAT
jgi:hypothetical protein